MTNTEIAQWAATGITALVGIVGLVLSILNWLRENPKIKVDLEMKLDKKSGSRPYFEVIISNIGRRPVFAKEADLYVKKFPLPKKLTTSPKPLNSSLKEGELPITHTIESDWPGLTKYIKNDRVFAVVKDTAETSHKSNIVMKPVKSN